MTFLRPMLLWGLLGLVVPVIIHLLGRRRVRVVPIGTLRFLERARARASSRWRVRKWLLLATRLGVLGALTLLYAGPGCRTPATTPTSTTWVLILDTSPSMGARREGRTSLERARSALIELVDAAGAADRFRVLTTEAAPLEAGGFGGADGARSALERARVTYAVHLPARAIERAATLLADEPGGRVVLASDLQAAGWPEGGPPDLLGASLSVLDAGVSDPRNGWVDRIRADRGRIEVATGGHGQADGVEVSLSGAGSRPLTAFPGPEARAVFQVPEGAEGVPLSVAVDPGGDLAIDDRVDFVVPDQARPKVLLVNGDPRGFEIRDELLFLRRALAPGTQLARSFDVDETRVGDLTAAGVEGADVLWLANPGPLAPGVAQRIAFWVEEGGALVVSAGDRLAVGPDGPAFPADLLPAPLRDRVVVPQDDPARPPFESLDGMGFSGPFADLASPDDGLVSVRIRTYWVLDARAGDGSVSWMGLSNGVPLVTEAPKGRGRILFVGTTIDRDAADLCLAPGFVPWVERLLLHAAGRLRPRVEPWAEAGHPLAMPYDEPVVVEGPGGDETGWRPGDGPFIPPGPGLYRVRTPDGAEDPFTARVPGAESDLTRLTKADLDRRLGEGNYVLGGGGPGTEGDFTGRKDRSGTVAAIVLGLVILEALLAARWRRRRPLPLEGVRS